MTAISKWQVFECIVYLICLFTTTGLVGYWIYKFSLDEDLSTVEYKQYDMKGINDASKSHYLSQTICFTNPFTTSKETHLNASEKLRVEGYLAGTEDMEDPDFNYNNVALNLTNYVKEYYIRWRNGTPAQTFKASEIPWKLIHNGFNGFWTGRFFRCFSLKSPDSDVASMSVLIENHVYNQGMFPSKLIFLAFIIIL